MQEPNIILDMLNQRSLLNHQIDKIYRYLYNPEWYYIAYRKLYKNGNNDEVIDDIIIKKINKIIEKIRLQKYQWSKTKVIENDKKKKLTVGEWSDKLVQEVLRMILSAIYEPKFSNSSHGFRINRNCDTALTMISQKFRGCMWFIKCSMTTFFDHNILLNILSKTIKDGRFIELIRKMLKANNFNNEFIYGKTYSGMPQGGILLPLFINIYFNELDQFIEDNLKSKFNKEERRKVDKAYNRKKSNIEKIRRKLKKITTKEQHQLSSKEPIRYSNFRRLEYIRYGNESIISLIGTYKEAVEIKDLIYMFLKDELNLELSSNDIQIIKSRKKPVKFLGYNIMVQICNTKITNKSRNVNGVIGLFIPDDIIQEKLKKYSKNGKPIHLTQLIDDSIFNIIYKYQNDFKGIAQYYKYARNQQLLSKLKWFMEVSMMKTIARKLKTSCAKIYKKYGACKEVNGKYYKIIQYSIVDKNGKMKTAYFGGIPLKRTTPNGISKIDDIIHDYYIYQ